jgi:hypothetical protein
MVFSAEVEVMDIKCCYGCVPPKRTPTCKFDGTCNKYAEAKAEHDAEKAEHDRMQAAKYGITSQKYSRVYAAVKKRRYKKV